MIASRVLAPVLLAPVLGTVLMACGDEAEVRPVPSTDVIDMGTPPSSAATRTPSSTPDVPPGADPDDVPIDRSTRDRLKKLALDEVGGGRVEEIERSDDPTHAYEVEVEQANDDATVLVSADFVVVGVDE